MSTVQAQTATGHFTFSDWEEKQVTSGAEGPRLARASVVNSFSGGVEAVGTACEYSIVYVTETTGTFTGMQVLSGTVGGRKGTFAVAENGSFEADGTLRCTFEVVPGSGTGDLTGLRGTGGFTTRHGEQSVPYSFEYGLGRLP
ncbi:hypothetical protein AN219_00350 [Streptomyces nanshensis]|nr:hypothetical protein AN219_00350 [Streptomyces nanshensis]